MHFVTNRSTIDGQRRHSTSPFSPLGGEHSPRASHREKRERPVTLKSPEAKCTKTDEIITIPLVAPSVVAYPTSVPLPSKTTILPFVELALNEPAFAMSSESKIAVGEYNDQHYLKPAGLLSFDQVLLPALELEEENAIKHVQSKVQRDAPEYLFVLEHCRQLTRQSIRNAIVAVGNNRIQRIESQAERRRTHALKMQESRDRRKQQRLEEQERELQERERQRKLSIVQKKQKMRQKLPKNLALWKEVVYLTSSIGQLDNEQRLWQQAEKDLMELEGHEQQPVNEIDSVPHESANRSNDAIVLRARKHSLQTEADRKVKDIAMASDRIQRGLEMILKLFKECEDVQKDLYLKYRKDHMFQGYQSIDDPKGVIRFLSQSQEDELD